MELGGNCAHDPGTDMLMGYKHVRIWLAHNLSAMKANLTQLYVIPGNLPANPYIQILRYVNPQFHARVFSRVFSVNLLTSITTKIL